MTKIVPALFITCFTCLSSAHADPALVSTNDQLVGCWSKIILSAELMAKMKVNPYPDKYQWYCFESDGTMHSLGSNSQLNPTAKSLREGFKLLPDGDLTYEIMKPGVIRVKQRSTNQEAGWDTRIFDKDYVLLGSPIEKGDIEMGLIEFGSSNAEKVVYWRILRPMQP